MEFRRAILAVACLALLAMGCGMPHYVIMDDPLSPQEHLELGLSYEKQGQYQSAAKEYQDAAKKIDVAWLLLGNAQFHMGQDDAAEEAFRQAMARMPGDPRPYNNLAWLLCARGKKLAEAEALARKALALAPAGKKTAYEDTLNKVRAARMEGGPFCQRPPKPKTLSNGPPQQ
ncbi:MAG: tetratricopeptide repeat protein [Deltaproteobacteria bacterium]|nr:tetratricopeptide repeat protein [Deltaproteobacteria bacterium]